MRILNRISIVLLGIIGIEYITLGIIGFFAIYTRSEFLTFLSFYVSNFFLVAPMALTQIYGGLAYCTTNTCGAGQTTILNARIIMMTLSILAILGGTIGLTGIIYMWKNLKVGYNIWLGLVLISIVVSLWNLKWFFFDSYYGNVYIGTTSTIWTLVYIAAFLLAKRSNTSNES